MMSFVWNTKFLAIAAGAAMLAAVEFSNIYVPDKIEDKLFFKGFYLVQKIVQKTVQFNNKK
jgi:hypothetical protein